MSIGVTAANLSGKSKMGEQSPKVMIQRLTMIDSRPQSEAAIRSPRDQAARLFRLRSSTTSVKLFFWR